MKLANAPAFNKYEDRQAKRIWCRDNIRRLRGQQVYHPVAGALDAPVYQGNEVNQAVKTQIKNPLTF